MSLIVSSNNGYTKNSNLGPSYFKALDDNAVLILKFRNSGSCVKRFERGGVARTWFGLGQGLKK